ncbi:Uncharacterised protein [Mycobacterium tuberculosis]|uniref:Uncharacterized protein n=2 Tax=Mycobacterium tuberculosis TaxID=1773 RepID=A0A0T9FRY1_MYCTX|nr:Uncharacterised protein [Mycobacterium tuberculosis]CFA91790.1 Uncharacterised protein [Mycobacterium tuberculosis]CFB93765.1 Uncharacterised protein [Mycobacterium tuberculosis]CFE41052.1 Uncharacterised protein [Mycobacterium tuberculosis]CFE83486.1 Uncharacterised protein [Mycobacterium tuberculosis]
MISTSGILSTGEKKWIPIKSSCRLTPVARPVIGSVEVLDPRIALGSTMSSISPNTLCLSSWFSKTASITKSTPLKSAASAVGVMRASRASLRSCVVRPRSSALASSFSE